MWTFIIIIFSIVLIGIGILVFIFYATSVAFKPNSPQEQLKEFGVNLIGYEFGNGYTVLESVSRNGHPDRPQDLKVKLDDEEYEKLKKELDKIVEGEERCEKDGILYIKTICKEDDGCSFVHSSIHKNCNYMFFQAAAIIDYSTKTIIFIIVVCYY